MSMEIPSSLNVVRSLCASGSTTGMLMDSCNGVTNTVIYNFTPFQTSDVLADHRNRFSRLKDVVLSLSCFWALRDARRVYL